MHHHTPTNLTDYSCLHFTPFVRAAMLSPSPCAHITCACVFILFFGVVGFFLLSQPSLHNSNRSTDAATVCPNCGKSNLNRSTLFCSSCGFRVTKQVASQPNNNNSSPDTAPGACLRMVDSYQPQQDSARQQQPVTPQDDVSNRHTEMMTANRHICAILALQEKKAKAMYGLASAFAFFYFASSLLNVWLARDITSAWASSQIITADLIINGVATFVFFVYMIVYVFH